MSEFTNVRLMFRQRLAMRLAKNLIYSSPIPTDHKQSISNPPVAMKQNGAARNLICRVLGVLAVFSVTLGVVAAPAAKWQSVDIGAVGMEGSVTQAQGEFIISGAGEDIWKQVDAFRFYFQPMDGDCTVMSRVVTIDSPRAKAGLMIRESLAADAKYAVLFFTPTQGVAYEQRLATAASASVGVYDHVLKMPYWLSLTRSGDVFTAYTSQNGATWGKMGSVTISMNPSSYVGLVVCSRKTGVLSEAHFDNVALKVRPPARK
jgi:regulation of enolase protein 1 (concanavalin A-like superfamily)